jgi:hypothetical protein
MYFEEAQESVNDKEDVINELEVVHLPIVLREHQTTRLLCLKTYIKGVATRLYIVKAFMMNSHI